MAVRCCKEKEKNPQELLQEASHQRKLRQKTPDKYLSNKIVKQKAISRNA